MPLLTLNGITVPIADGSLSQEAEVIGETARAFSGTLRANRRIVKRNFGFGIPYGTLDDVEAWRGLFLGLGHTFSWDSNFYSSKGLGPSAGTNGTIDATQKKFGASSLRISANSTFTWNVGLIAKWTVSVWKYVGTAWVHYVVRSDGAKWENGSRNDGLATAWLTVNGNFSLTNSTAGDEFYDDCAAVPYLWPEDWVAAVYASGAAFGLLPKLQAGGDLLPAGAYIGDASESDYAQGVVAGTWQTIRALSVALREV